MKSSKRILSIFLITVFTLYTSLSSVPAMAISSRGIAVKVTEAKLLVKKAAAIQTVAMTKVVKAKKIETMEKARLKIATDNLSTAKTLNSKILVAKALSTAKLSESTATTARILADKEAALAVSSYKLAVKAKTATEKLAKAKTSRSRAVALKVADAAVKAAKAGATKAAIATKISIAAVTKASAATKAAIVAEKESALDKAAIAKAAADKAAAEKAAADKIAAEKAAAAKAAADKAAAEKAAAEKAAAEKAAAEKAAADAAAAAAAAAAKVRATSVTVTTAGNTTTIPNGSVIQMVATVAPANTADKTVTWIVAPGTGTAVINAQTGVLTATGVGTVTVVAINTASGITGMTVLSIVIIASTIVGEVVTPGTAYGTTRVVYTPSYGHSLRYVKQAGAFAIQVVGTNVSSIGIAYASGTNIYNAYAYEHLGLYEVDSNSRIVKFKDITLLPDHIATAAPSIVGYSVIPGTIANSTRIIYSPSSTNTLRVIKQSGAFATPLVGTNASTLSGALYYSSGIDITNAVVGQHIGLYEVNPYGLVVKFVDITLYAGYVATPTPVITGYAIGPGTLAGSTKITYTPGYGNTLRFMKQAGAFTTPLVGSSAVSISSVYTTGADITGALATQHIGLYEVNANGLVVKFVDITLVAANIAVAAATPVISNYTVEQGSVVGSTKILYTAGYGNTLRYAKQAGAFVVPLVGSYAGGTGTAYTSGTNITGVAVTQHIGLYEIDAASHVVKFVDITLGTGDIAVEVAAPVIKDYAVEPGTVAGSTKVTYAVGSGNSLKYMKQAGAFTTPVVGLNITSIGTPYTSGANITGAEAGQHIGLYEVDTNKLVVKFVDITLGSGDIVAPAITSHVVGQGTIAGATKVTYTAGSGNTLRYFKQAGAFVAPLVGSSASSIGAVYTSGANILGAEAGQHIGLYEVDVNGLVIKFVDITLSSADIAAVSAPAPALTGCTVAKGTVADSTKVTYIPGSGNTLRYMKQDGAFTTPLLGTNVGGTEYSSEANITGVGVGQHIGLYEVDKDNLVIKFVDITLAAENIAVAAPTITGYTIAQGTETGSTKITNVVVGSGNILKYVKQSGAFTIPLVGTTASGTEYVVGTDILGAKDTEHIGLYEVDLQSSVVKFTDITLVTENIK